VLKRLKERAARKAAAAVKSSTIGVVGLLLAGAAWVQTNPELVNQVVGDGWGGVAVAVAAVVVAVARLRSL
jgi:hypothetical protein